MTELTDGMIWIIVLPIVAAILSFLYRPLAAQFGLLTAIAQIFLVAGLTWQIASQGPQSYALGGWTAPLGIGLYADGLSVTFLIMTTLICGVIGLYATAYFPNEGTDGYHDTEGDSRNFSFFWPLWLMLWAALNGLFLSNDIFNIYVTLELLGLAAVALVALGTERAALVAGLRYLFVNMLGSLTYLMGVALLYAALATLDLRLVGQSITASPVTWWAVALVIVGMLLKTALFPLHFWLPPAHSTAPAPASALLSALVVKAPFYLLLRLWFDVFDPVITPSGEQLLGSLGAIAIVWGSLQALRQRQLKLLIAYSTVAQIGYLFLVFALAQEDSGRLAWMGAVYMAISHAFAKAALFLAAGNFSYAAGHDAIAELGSVVRKLPVSTSAFALAGISLVGFPPLGGFIGKWLMLQAAFSSGQWWWTIIIAGGGLLTAVYVFRITILFFARETPDEPENHSLPPKRLEWSAFSMAVATIILGLLSPYLLMILDVAVPTFS